MREHPLYTNIKLFVQTAMEDPVGSEEAQIEHVNNMRKAEVDENARRYVKQKMKLYIKQEYRDFDDDALTELTEQLYGDIYGLGVLQHLDEMKGVAEIFIDAEETPDFRCMVHIKENGKAQYRYDGPVYETLDELRSAFDNMLRFSGQQINAYANASIEAIRPSGDRIQIAVPEDSHSWMMRVRKFDNFYPTLENMVKYKTLTPDMVELVRLFVDAGEVNMAVMGSMGTAKTSTINGLLEHTPITEGITAIVEIDEMNHKLLRNHLLTVLKIDEKRGIGFEDHLSTALRTSASRIIVPESRGKGFPTLIRTLNQIRGGMFTIHAHDSLGGMYVMTDMFRGGESTSNAETEESIQSKIAQAVDIAIVMRRVGETIRMWSISEYLQDDKGRFSGVNDLFRFVPDPENPQDGHFEYTGNRISPRLRKFMNDNEIPKSRLDRW